MSHGVPRTAWILLVLGLGTTLPVAAWSGHVVGPDGKPIEGARVCYMAGSAPVHCVPTNKNGYFTMIPSRLQVAHITASGFLPKKVAAAPRDTPIRLEPSASIRIELRDATTGEPISGGKIMILHATGKQLGPLPTEDAGVVLFRTMLPGSVRLTATADGYAEGRSPDVELVAGEEARVTLELEPLTAADK